ncbi:MAG: hypothetical protein PHQ14_04620 [Chromatiales bacterium]|jgi:hypothetical protein|nr:hypothetical protein [Chromatiales bacterium]MDX9766773.1 hypothetical protein [Ectothiorhodospiraceae bacterium]
MKQALVRAGLLMALLLCLFQSVMVTVAWWQGRLYPDLFDWLWIAALPVLVGVYLRYFSVLGCRQCQPADDLPNDPPKP